MHSILYINTFKTEYENTKAHILPLFFLKKIQVFSCYVHIHYMAYCRPDYNGYPKYTILLQYFPGFNFKSFPCFSNEYGNVSLNGRFSLVISIKMRNATTTIIIIITATLLFPILTHICTHTRTHTC